MLNKKGILYTTVVSSAPLQQHVTLYHNRVQSDMPNGSSIPNNLTVCTKKVNENDLICENCEIQRNYRSPTATVKPSVGVTEPNLTYTLHILEVHPSFQAVD